jgi:hypothetical protein
MNALESLTHYFVKPIAIWLLVIFVAQTFFYPMITTWAGDLLSMFWTQVIDDVKGLFW